MQRPFPNGKKRPFGFNVYVTAVAAGQSQRSYSGVGNFNLYYLSSPPQIPRRPWVGLETGGLMCYTARTCTGSEDFQSDSRYYM